MTEADKIKTTLIELITKQIGCPAAYIESGANGAKFTVIPNTLPYTEVRLYVFDNRIEIAVSNLNKLDSWFTVISVPLNDPQAIPKIVDAAKKYAN